MGSMIMARAVRKSIESVIIITQYYNVLYQPFQIIKFYCMQKPISRRNHPYPREFLVGTQKSNIKTNLYTFNPASSTYSSTRKQSMEKQPNPEEANIVKQVPAQSINSKVYYDADAKLELQLTEPNQIHKLGYNEPKQPIQIPHKIKSNASEIEQNQYGDMPLKIQCNSQIFKESRLARSGLIVRQSKFYQPQQVIQAKTQKSFNRLGLSLMGVKRSKYNRSCLQKKTSFSISQHVPTKGSNRYSPNKEQGEPIYKHSYYPFKAKQIQNLKNEINRISGGSRVKKVEKSGQLQHYLESNLNCASYLPSADKQQFLEIRQNNAKQAIRINIKTSISALKDLLFCNLKQKQVLIQLPRFFTQPPSQLLRSNNFDAQVLNNQCFHIFTSLNIPVTNLNIRKYSNCLVIINKNICIVWHEGHEGKKYIGEWKNKYFDEGQKEGLGLQWAPGRYVYYGQFKQNKRHGFGLMRKNNSTLNLGYWKSGKYFQYGIQKNL